MVAAWALILLFFLIGIADSERKILPLAVLMAIVLGFYQFSRKPKEEISPVKSPLPTRSRPPTVALAPEPTSLSTVDPYTCKSCGAANTGPNVAASCDFCGAAAPVVKKAPPPPVPMSAAPAAAVDDGIRVSGSGWVCRSCGTYSTLPKLEMPGSTVLEVVLWFFYIIPGVCYSVWRRNDANAVKTCGICQKTDLTPVASPEGRALFQRKYGNRPRFD